MAKTTPESWFEQAQYDMATARAMFDAGRHLYVIFCCQQAVEKTIKAIIVRGSDDMPPRLHDLMRLADHAGLHPPPEHARHLRALSEYYIQSRYPDRVSDALGGLTDTLARDILNQTAETLRWLSSVQ